LEGLQKAPWQVQVCKLADVYDNLLDSVNLPAEKRPHSLGRARSYVEGLEASAVAQTKRPLELVKELLAKQGR
jgi:hypothetical protein